MKQYLFMIGEGQEKLLLVMTRERLVEMRELADSVLDTWKEDDDFAYLAYSGQLTYKMTGQTVEGGGSKQGG